MSEQQRPDHTTGAASDGGPNPLDRQRALMDLLSQETRHDIVQALLGHPEHLASEQELDYLVDDKSRGAVEGAIDRLVEEGILAIYEHPPNESTRDYPYKFIGFTEYGVDVLDQFNYLKGVPLARALHDSTRKSSTVERHEDAPRPDLPPAVEEALYVPDDATPMDTTESPQRT
jgi:hypothetical protein